MVNKISLFLLMMLSSCKVRYAELGIKRQNYESLPFATNGYYYNLSMGDDSEYVNVDFYYKNGVKLTWGHHQFSNFDEVEKGFLDKGQLLGVGYSRNRWSVFEIRGDTMVLETWNQSLTFKKGTFKMYRLIVNDTTIYSIGLDKYYHFKRFRPKPDSTLSPIK